MKDAECKRYVAPKCSLDEDKNVILGQIYGAKVIDWTTICSAVDEIETNSYHLETIKYTNRNSRMLFNDDSRKGKYEPSEERNYLHKEGFLIRYKDENNFEFSGLGLIWTLDIYGTDLQKLEYFTERLGLAKNLK